uniref:Uncharacterized protein n=1 Tax=Monodon monoceros TaxID=40151 RepID=A0A8C6AHZ9_MONMO
MRVGVSVRFGRGGRPSAEHAKNTLKSQFGPHVLLKVFDQSALSTEAKEEMYKLYPNARRAHLKTGGNFPYLCRSAEVNLYRYICCNSTEPNMRPLTHRWSVLRSSRCRKATLASVRRSSSC